MFRTIAHIFLKPAYIAITIATAFTAFALTIWLPSLAFITSVLGNTNVFWGDKIIFLFSLLGSITTNFTFLSALGTVLIALLFGVQISLIVYLLRSRSLALAGRSAATSGAGMGVGLLGVGCAACGSLVLTAIIPVIGASGVLALLPLRGAEFSLLGAIIIAVSIFFTVRRMTRPAVCNPTLT